MTDDRESPSPAPDEPVGHYGRMSGISIRTMLVYHPYEGCLEGWPSPESCVAQAREKAKSLFPDTIPVLVVEPERRQPKVEPHMRDMVPPLIPRLAYVALLHGPALTSKDPRLDASELVLIWFSDQLERPGLPFIDWPKHAASISYEDF